MRFMNYVFFFFLCMRFIKYSILVFSCCMRLIKFNILFLSFAYGWSTLISFFLSFAWHLASIFLLKLSFVWVWSSTNIYIFSFYMRFIKYNILLRVSSVTIWERLPASTMCWCHPAGGTVILAYLNEKNRPYSSQDIFCNLQKQHGFGKTVRIHSSLPLRRCGLLAAHHFNDWLWFTRLWSKPWSCWLWRAR